MPINVNQKHEKEIIALNNFEAVRLRPDRHIGQTAFLDEKLQIIRNNKLFLEEKRWSPGLNHLIVEILENAIDEAKRCKNRKMKNIYVTVNLDYNQVTIIDEGNGFYKATSMNQRSKKNVVRTAYEELNAGSNFTNTETNILGTHGVGSAICNILSKYFKVKTVNSSHSVEYEWNDFEIVDEKIEKKKKGEKKGTIVSFIPSEEVFGDFRWDKEIISTYLSYKSLLISLDDSIKDLRINGTFIENGEEKEIPITKDFIPQDHISISTKIGNIFLWESYENSCSLSFVNGSKCTGIHQKIINDWLNGYFKYNLAHHFYETLVILNVPSNLMRFGDQNKTRYSVSRNEIEELLEHSFKRKLISTLKKSDLSEKIDQKIESKLYDENIKKIKKSKKKSKRKISEKYAPPSKRKLICYITEGDCLEENTKITIIRNNKILDKEIKDVKENDIVITHKNRFKPITHVNKLVKKAIKINTGDDQLICSENHKWFVYDKIKEEFYFEKTSKLKKDRHKLVKNYLAFLDSFEEIKKIKGEDNNLLDKLYKHINKHEKRKNYREPVDIEDISYSEEYVKMVDISVKTDESFVLSNGIVSHNSAAGSVKQARDSRYEGVYAIKGKIKNTKKLSDLTENKEILEIMNILGLDPSKENTPSFQKIVIATDEDCLDENTLVITEKGPKKIKSIDYDDKIMTHDGSYESVRKITQTKKDEQMEIQVNGETFITSLYHRLIVQRDGDIQEIYAKDLKKTDFLLLQKTEENHKNIITKDLDLKNFKLVQPNKIERKKNKNYKMFDLSLNGNKTFFIHLNNSTKVLSHNSDGHHIAALLINFFYKWFPSIIEKGYLYKLATPLIACKYKNKSHYFYSFEEFNKFKKDKTVSDVTYLKGLGSLDINDWYNVMKNKKYFQIVKDKSSDKFIDIAFGKSTEKRRKWLRK